MRLTRDQARAMLLGAQGLLRAPAPGASKADVLETIRRMGVLQIDTIHVVARSPYLVLWTRLGDYEPRWLDELLAEGAIFEYWSHAICFLPIEAYPLSRFLMLNRSGRRAEWAYEWIEEHPDVVARVHDAIRAGGAVRSADFERTDGQAGGWWNHKPEKRALEQLFNTGEVMIARRHNFQRIYDLRERVLPDWDDATVPTEAEQRRLTALKAVRALGVASARWTPDYFRTPKTGAAAVLAELAEAGELLPAEVDGWREPAYIHPDHRALAETVLAGDARPERTTLLSPFDPIVWDRARALALFDFDYRIECYTPAPQRRYGYFTLPILHRDRIVGRLDPKAHRRAGEFEVKALHLEPGVEIDDDLTVSLARALHTCAAWHGTPELVIRQSDPPAFGERLAGALRELAR